MGEKEIEVIDFNVRFAYKGYDCYFTANSLGLSIRIDEKYDLVKKCITKTKDIGVIELFEYQSYILYKNEKINVQRLFQTSIKKVKNLIDGLVQLGDNK